MSWESPTGRGPVPPVRLNAALDQVLAGLGAPPMSSIEGLARLWDSIVGPVAASHLRPVTIVDETLIVAADSPVWKGQARWFEAAVLEAVASLVGEGVVTAMRVRLE